MIAKFLISFVLSLIVFLTLGYLGIANYIIELLLKLTGLNFYQGEDRFTYINYFMEGIFAFIFLFIFILVNKWSKKDKPN